MMNQLVLGRRCIMFLNLALVSALLLPSLLIAHQEEVEDIDVVDHQKCDLRS